MFRITTKADRTSRTGSALSLVMILGLCIPEASFASDDVDPALIAACPALSEWASEHPPTDHENQSAAQGSPADLARELSRRVALDQEARAPLSSGQPPEPAVIKNLVAVDSDNLHWLKDIVEKQGFPTDDQVGISGVFDA